MTMWPIQWSIRLDLQLVFLVICTLPATLASGSPDAESYHTIPTHLDPPPPPTLTAATAATDTAANQFLGEYDRQASEMCNRVAHAEWKYAINGSDFNRRRMNEQLSVAARFECLSWRRASTLVDRQPETSPAAKRQLDRILRQGKCGLGDDKFAEYLLLVQQMTETFRSARVCGYRPFGDNINGYVEHPTDGVHKPDGRLNFDGASQKHSSPDEHYYCDLRLEPDLVHLMATSRSEPELRHLWLAWHDKTGPPLRNTFMRYLEVANQAARQHGYRNAGEQQRAAYEDGDFYFIVQDLWTRVRPLYQQLFSYVRQALVQRYGPNVVRHDGPIPAHLLGNMWAQNWQSLMDDGVVTVSPGKGSGSTTRGTKAASISADVSGEMLRQGFTPLRIFQAAEEFFTSMGLPPMLPEFWRNSMLQTPVERHAKCSASAWDFCNNVDYRIKQCTQITRDDLVNTHHELTHIQYFMHYAGQPYVFRDGPNPGFSEAVAHAIGLSVGGPAHLHHLGLLNVASLSDLRSGNSPTNIEYLLELAMDKLPLMSFALALEKWRWYAFEKGPIGLNARWWDMRLRYQGLIPPAARLPEHLDAAAKLQIVTDQDYIRYYVATVLQFQIFAELCAAAGHRGPLHMCDVYRSREAGRILSELMQHGAALSASQLLRVVTRGKTDRLSVEPLLEFFRPLAEWLQQQNRNEPVIGWNSNLNDVGLFQAALYSGGGRSGDCGWWGLSVWFGIVGSLYAVGARRLILKYI